MNRSTSHLFWLLPLGVVACLLAMIYLPQGLYLPLRWLFPSGGPPTGSQLFIFSVVRFLLPCVAVGISVTIAAIWLARREGGRAFLPACRPRPDATTRTTDALVLAGMAIPVLVVIATVPSNHGMLLHLSRLTPSAAKVQLAVAVVASTCVLAALAVAAKGWGVAATVFAAAILTNYSVFLNSFGDLIQKAAAKRSGGTRVVINTSLPGAEMWINGVYVGKSPYVTTYDEFVRNVPTTMLPSVDLECEEFQTAVVRVTQPLPFVCVREKRRQWIREHSLASLLKDRLANAKPPSSGTGASGLQPQAEYYIRVRYAGEWGCESYEGGGGGSGGREAVHTSLAVYFPNHQKRLDTLINKARLTDYRVMPEWLAALDTYGDEAWWTLTERGAKEPELLTLVDAWARWKYDLDRVANSDDAWKAFQRICDEAEAEQAFLTSSVAGRAVDLLVPQLDPEELCRLAISWIQEGGGLGWQSAKVGDRRHFGTVRRPRGFAGPLGGHIDEANYSSLPVKVYPVIAAVWVMDRYLDGIDDTQANIVERQLVPALIRYQYHKDMAMEAAIELGGPNLTTFLLRQDWQTPAGSGANRNHSVAKYLGWSAEVNKWLYWLAHLRGPAGDLFRTTHSKEVLELAEAMCGKSHHDLTPPEFLFYDLSGGQNSLAFRFWPSYCRHAEKVAFSHWQLKTRCGYLVQMEPVSTLEMYIEARRRSPLSYGQDDGMPDLFDRLPAPRRREIIDAWTEEIRSGRVPVEPDRSSSHTEGQVRNMAIRSLEYYLKGEDTRQFGPLGRSLADMKKPESSTLRSQVSEVLQYGEVNLPMVSELASSDMAELRLTVVAALRAHPTPAYRQILNKLLQDPDERVRQAAENVRTGLEELVAMPLEQLRSDSPTSLAAD